MTKLLPSLALLGASFTLQGCLAAAAVDVVTAPVKIASRTVDLATTSQSEADEKRGRDLRKREQRFGQLEREWHKEEARCQKGRAQSCTERDRITAEMDALRPTLPQSYAR